MAGLAEQLFNRPHRWVQVADNQGRLYHYPQLDEPVAYTARVKVFGEGRSEIFVRSTDLQRVLNTSTAERPRGRRVAPVVQDAEDIERAAKRARQAVRSLCLRIRADHMHTFGTRAVLPFDVLLTRFQRWLQAYQRYLKRRGLPRFLYVAVPERHPSNPDHFHIHVGAHGRLDGAALSIWHALCAGDCPDHEINGSINFKAFYARRHNQDVPTIVAGYIAKYIGKELVSAFNRKRYWATRSVTPEEVNHIILRSKNWGDVQRELTERLGIDWASVLICNAGCVFVLPNDEGLWIKILPHTNQIMPF